MGHNALKVLAGVGATSQTYVDDVFSTYLYTGNGSTQTITNNIDLSTYGGLVWFKARNSASYIHSLYDTARGATISLNTNNTTANETRTGALTSFGTTGFTIGDDPYVNEGGTPTTYASWTFRKAAKFFDVQTKSHTNGAASTVDLTTLGTVGQVVVKRTDSTGNWYVWHRSLTSGYNIYLNTTAAEFNTNAYLSVSGTTLTIASGMPTGTYVVYGFAHDTTSTGIIQCGSFTTDGSGNATVGLGWEPQYVIMKRTDVAQNWFQLDTMRGWVSTTNASKVLIPNATSIESTVGSSPTATGFTTDNNLTNASATYIYLAIRRPNKPPTSGTQVFTPYKGTGSGTKPFWKSGHVADALFGYALSGNAVYPLATDRLRGAIYSTTSAAAVETSDSTFTWDYMNGAVNVNDLTTYAAGLFKRAPGFFDVVCYTGTGANKTESHNLTVAPEMMILKNRSDATGRAWAVWHSGIANTEYLVLNTTAAKATDATYWNSTSPTTSAFSVGTTNSTNESADTFVAYLFATLAGISKVGSYTGNGSSQTINCGFSAGARFILIKRTDSTGDWYVYDTARGINAGNDPHISLNSTAAEVNTTDDIDSDNTGFIVNQNATTNLNVTSATYIYLAVA